MKKCTYAFLFFSIAIVSCKKNKGFSGNADPVRSAGKYSCFCTTTVSFVDHCGTSDEFTDTSFVNASNLNEAVKLCSAESIITSSTYTITQKVCEIK